jgi:hypothetical protein
MSKYDALFEDEDDVFAGTPVSKYWEISQQLSEDLRRDEFDLMVEKMAVMEAMLSETHDYENLDQIVKNYAIANYEKIDNLKKSVYMELAGQLIYRVSE